MNKEKIKKIQMLFQGIPDKVPKGWYTASQLVDILGKRRSTVSHMLLKLTKRNKGELKIKNFNIRQANNVRSVPHYFFNL
jgi:ABC-type enterochelin transport system ATPase subunit